MMTIHASDSSLLRTLSPEMQKERCVQCVFSSQIINPTYETIPHLLHFTLQQSLCLIKVLNAVHIFLTERTTEQDFELF